MQTGVIHGDIKPQNILVFKEGTGFNFKVADFGFSVLLDGTESKVNLPMSRPWNARETRGISIAEARSADWYSFAMLCFWILLTDRGYLPEQESEVSFEIPDAQETELEKLKESGKLTGIAQEIIAKKPGLSDDHKSRLATFFQLTLPSYNQDRVLSPTEIMKLLG